MAYCTVVSKDQKSTTRCRTTSFASLQGASCARCAVKLSNATVISDVVNGGWLLGVAVYKYQTMEWAACDTRTQRSARVRQFWISFVMSDAGSPHLNSSSKVAIKTQLNNMGSRDVDIIKRLCAAFCWALLLFDSCHGMVNDVLAPRCQHGDQTMFGPFKFKKQVHILSSKDRRTGTDTDRN